MFRVNSIEDVARRLMHALLMVVVMRDSFKNIIEMCVASRGDQLIAFQPTRCTVRNHTDQKSDYSCQQRIN